MKKLLLAFSLLVAGNSGAFAQAFPNYPTLNVPDGVQCLSFSNNGRCSQFRPAGPTALTGAETVPADTNAASGAQPQTIRIPILALNAGPYQYNAPLTGASVTVLSTSRRLVLEPAGTIAALTLAFPAATALQDNQTFGLCSRQVITALTVTNGTGTTVLDPPTAMSATSAAPNATNCYEWVYRVANTSWYRVQ